jgi:hypothetical protein
MLLGFLRHLSTPSLSMMLISNTLSPRSASLLFCYALLPYTLAHMEMSQPLPMRSRFDPMNTAAETDYNLKSPLNADGSNFPCHGYQNDRPIRTTATYTTGQSYEMQIAGTTTHGGGSCQLSLSYDNGASFKVSKALRAIRTLQLTFPSLSRS